MSFQKAWNNFSRSCACGHGYDEFDDNCAHFLSNALILGGFNEIDGGDGGNLREVNGFCVCRGGRPIRAKELRAWFRRKWNYHSKPVRDGIILVYQEDVVGTGHVLLQEYRNGAYVDHKGTGNYPAFKLQEYYY